MKGNLQHAIKLTFGEEGGLSLDRQDPGNWTGGKVGVGRLVGTKYGIAAHAHPNLDIANLTMEDAAAILDKGYWRKVWGDDLPAGLDYAMFDYAVNSGPAQAVKDVQRVVGGVDTDGSIGPKTLKAIMAASPPVVIRGLMDHRLAFMKKLANWEHNKNGWTARVAHVREAALEMTSIAPETVAAASKPVAAVDGAMVPAKPAETAVASTGQGKVNIAAIVGGVVAAVPQAVVTLTPYADRPWVHTVLPVLAFVGLIGALAANAIGLKVQSDHIAGGSPQ
jgi:lysozyme family protein